ncbi:hypothetical protein [Ramlibacter sp. WS9]|uniref:hypothetical protein n=1 Tax=Ramlibacter sp. WS9 TaxID=1882741 RepID=UPI001143CC80|nr:hypothetical protein [Ramlibacter sp. WS9]ROZ66229.1 hypothetical protein EEB15_27035 [Ramlibacter sp. WS9]
MHHERSSSPCATHQAEPSAWTLLFRPLFQAGRGFAFPCDPQGGVDMDALSERARNNYLYARAMMGREVTWPSVQREDFKALMPA